MVPQELQRGESFAFTRLIMQTSLKALLIVGFGALLTVQAAPSVLAADLAVTPVKKRVILHQRSRIVRDLDGTPIIVRRARPMVVRAYDGTVIVRPLYENISVRSAAVLPRYYLNGQPVLPSWPRGWPPGTRGRV
jgi:hypothetical protein